MSFGLPDLRLPISILMSIALASGSHRAEEAGRAGYLSPPELIKLAEGSERTYMLRPIEELGDLRVENFAEVFWPSMADSSEYPRISTDNDGRRTLSEYDLEEDCRNLLMEGESLFDSRQYDEARPIYERAAKMFPTCYVAHSHVGDCHYFQNDSAKALTWYRKALSLNPHDFRNHFYIGNALFKLNRLQQARDAYVQALALRPHRESVVKALRARADKLGIHVVDQPFVPRALAREEDGQIGVYVDGSSPYWLVYGLCKGVWIGEPEHRQKRTGDTKHVWSLVEERQCLMSMLESYYAVREDESVERDPEMERILESLKSEVLDGFVLYEIAYRLHGHATLLLPREVFDDVVKYVDLQVLAEAGRPR